MPHQSSLGSRLIASPPPLRFGTSGRRGEVVHLTQLEVYLNALAELEFLQSRPRSAGGIARGEEFFLAYDLRPSSSRFVPEQEGRGEIAQAIVRAIRDAGLTPVNLGRIPTPALTAYALARGRGSIMVTGSHIPFDRNGYKTNTAAGELLKRDEAPINQRVAGVRQRLYEQALADSPFDERGMFRTGHQELPAEQAAAGREYVARYTRCFAEQSLQDQRVLVYEHSAVGRELLVQVLRQFGAEVVTAGRSETFVPVDTENIDAAQLARIQALVDDATEDKPFTAVVSADGDSDRPLVLGVEVPGSRVRFFGGDLVGMVTAEFLGTDAVVVPISCNDGIDRGPLARVLEPKTRIGSPYVIEGMERARARGRRAVCGWEANGGFLVGSDLERGGRVLPALPTRDAVLPILGVLFAAATGRCSVTEVFQRLPPRYSRAALLRPCPREVGRRIVARFSPADPVIREARFARCAHSPDSEMPPHPTPQTTAGPASPPGGRGDPESSPLPSGGEGQGEGEVRVVDEANGEQAAPAVVADQLRALRAALAPFFPTADGFGEITRINWVDGLRVGFDNGDVAHVRPSGNADELRIYAVADTQERADAIARQGVAEPGGLLPRLAQVC